jgi:CubicO group peptidase (beta-lactamase class C family)
MKKIIIILIMILFIDPINFAQADPAPSNTSPQFYTVQVEDTLAHLADKFYRDPSAWPAIWLATNTTAAQDPRFALPDSPYSLGPGQLLFIPPQTEVAQLQARYLAENTLENLGPSARVHPITAGWLAEFTAYVEEARRHFGIPGAALTIVRDNQIVLAQGFGVRKLGENAPVTPETIFGIGSTSKAMNSMLLATLVEEGVLDWDQLVIEIWPDFRLSDQFAASQIRVRDLLNMSSGVPRSDLQWSGVGFTAEEVMMALEDLPVVAPRGQRFQYNNQMVATGGYIAALAAGGEYGHLAEAYARLLQERVFEPVGMDSASLSIEAAQANPNHATPHDFTLAGEVLPTYFHADPGLAPAGGINTNVMDLARFLLTQLNRGTAPDGARVVSAAHLVETWQPQVEAFQDTAYALGWFVETYQDVELIWHDGDVLGFKSLLIFIPEARVGLALVTNRTISYGFSNTIRYRLVELLYGLKVEAGLQYKEQWTNFIGALPNIRAPLEASPEPAEVAAYLGQYSAGWQVEQRADGTLWTVRGPYQWQLLAAGNGQFIINNGFGITSELNFVTDENGNVVMIIKLSTGETGEFRHV